MMALSDPRRKFEDLSPRDPVQLLVETVLQHGDLDGILPELLPGIADALGAASAIMFFVDEESRELVVAASCGIYSPPLPAGKRLPMSETAIAKGKPLEWKTLSAPVPGIAYSAGAAMIVDSTFLGSLHVGWDSTRASRSDFSRLQGFADRLALAIDHGR